MANATTPHLVMLRSTAEEEAEHDPSH